MDGARKRVNIGQHSQRQQILQGGIMKVLHRRASLVLGLLALVAAGPRATANDEVLALTGATVYTSPEAAPIVDGVVLMQAGRITAVGAKLTLPANTRAVDCTGLFVAAGFQNSHVHFTETKWADAAAQAPEILGQQLREMLTRYGFTTVVDTGSFLPNTVALRRRIEAGSVPGPRILTAGAAIYPRDGIPFYVKDSVPAEVLPFLNQPATPEEAAAAVRWNIAGGADVVKIFTGSLSSPRTVVPMREDIARAAVAEAHRQGTLVFTHPSNAEGIRVALAAGVDILAHTAPQAGPWDDALVSAMKERRLSLVPTLKLWAYEATRFGGTADAAEQFTAGGIEQLRAFARAGGQVLFGTDVGYMREYDPRDEYVRMAQAGLSPMQILASLTTAPAARFGEETRRGRIAAGMDADLVVLEADPARDVRNFGKVRYTIRAGCVIFSPDAAANDSCRGKR
jgi:imidazolonepropionase-like amidohydrolase